MKLLMAPPVTVTSLEMKFAEDSDRVKVIVSVWPVARFADPARVMVTVGTVVSTLCVDCVATSLWVNVALFVEVSRIVPEFNTRESAAIAKPSVSVSPATTVYVNTSDDVPLPDEYVANLLVRPTSGIRGEPETTTFSEKATVTEMMSLVL